MTAAELTGDDDAWLLSSSVTVDLADFEIISLADFEVISLADFEKESLATAEFLVFGGRGGRWGGLTSRQSSLYRSPLALTIADEAGCCSLSQPPPKWSLLIPLL